MDSFEWNKIAGWVLTAAIAVLGLSIVTGMLYSPHNPEQKGYIVEGVELEAEGGGAAAAAEKPIAFYLASANVEKGAATFKKCAACHTIDAGGANGIGPNLHGVVGASHAHAAGFSYSPAMAATKGKPWGFDELNEWLKSPKAYIPGNKMSFAGISKPEDRANVIAYLNSQGSNLPLPAVPAETAAAAPADTAAGPEQTPAAEKAAPGPSKAADVPEATQGATVARGGPAAKDVAGRAKDEKK